MHTSLLAHINLGARADTQQSDAEFFAGFVGQHLHDLIVARVHQRHAVHLNRKKGGKRYKCWTSV